MPMFEVCEEDPDRLQCCHHPFTAPVERGAFLSANTRDELLALRSQSYDLVVNGIELGGGSIRIHREDDQRRFDAPTVDTGLSCATDYGPQRSMLDSSATCRPVRCAS